jgi:transcriptional regulator
VGRLTDRHEGTRSQPWRVEDAPEAYIQSQLKGIVGIELTVQHIQGKLKLSQNRPERDRQGTERGLAGTGDAGAAALAKMMADLPR